MAVSLRLTGAVVWIINVEATPRGAGGVASGIQKMVPVRQSLTAVCGGRAAAYPRGIRHDYLMTATAPGRAVSFLHLVNLVNPVY